MLKLNQMFKAAFSKQCHAIYQNNLKNYNNLFKDPNKISLSAKNLV